MRQRNDTPNELVAWVDPVLVIAPDEIVEWDSPLTGMTILPDSDSAPAAPAKPAVKADIPEETK